MENTVYDAMSKRWYDGNNLNELMTYIFEISNNEFHNLRSNAVNFHIP